MGFLKLFNVAKYKDNKDTPKLGKVIYNQDPKKLGRLKVQVEGLFEPTDSIGSNLPWVRRKSDSFLTSNDTQSFSVPKVGDVVEVIWPYDDKHAFYRGVSLGSYNNTGAFSDNYPYQSGFAVGDLDFIFDEPTHSVIISNGERFKITADATGEITIEGARIEIKGDADINLKADNVNIDGNLTVTGAIESAIGANGVITFANSASVSGGIVTAIS